MFDAPEFSSLSPLSALIETDRISPMHHTDPLCAAARSAPMQQISIIHPAHLNKTPELKMHLREYVRTAAAWATADELPPLNKNANEFRHSLPVESLDGTDSTSSSFNIYIYANKHNATRRAQIPRSDFPCANNESEFDLISRYCLHCY